MENQKNNLDEEFNVNNIDSDKSLQALKTFIEDVTKSSDNNQMYQDVKKMIEDIESKRNK